MFMEEEQNFHWFYKLSILTATPGLKVHGPIQLVGANHGATFCIPQWISRLGFCVCNQKFSGLNAVLGRVSVRSVGCWGKTLHLLKSATGVLDGCQIPGCLFTSTCVYVLKKWRARWDMWKTHFPVYLYLNKWQIKFHFIIDWGRPEYLWGAGTTCIRKLYDWHLQRSQTWLG